MAFFASGSRRWSHGETRGVSRSGAAGDHATPGTMSVAKSRGGRRFQGRMIGRPAVPPAALEELRWKPIPRAAGNTDIHDRSAHRSSQRAVAAYRRGAASSAPRATCAMPRPSWRPAPPPPARPSRAGRPAAPASGAPKAAALPPGKAMRTGGDGSGDSWTELSPCPAHAASWPVERRGDRDSKGGQRVGVTMRNQKKQARDQPRPR
jgi:hypothetical protein